MKRREGSVKKSGDKGGNKKEKKSFVRIGMRVSFFAMIFLTALFLIVGSEIIINDAVNLILSLIWIVSIPFCFVTSIIHIVKYKEKLLPIIAFSTSLLLVLVVALGYVIMFS